MTSPQATQIVDVVTPVLIGPSGAAAGLAGLSGLFGLGIAFIIDCQCVTLFYYKQACGKYSKYVQYGTSYLLHEGKS